jgi:DNA-binding transcriptional LysR family regulator
LAPIRMVPVAAPGHPVAAHKGRVPRKRLADAVQIVLSERRDVGVADQGVLSARTWRVADLHTKHEMLRAGLGWGNLPEHVVRDDLRAGRLVEIRPESWAKDEHTLYLSTIYRSDTILGPAHLWLLGQLEVFCARDARAARERGKAPRARRKRKP